MAVKIREATAKDYGGLCELIGEVDTLHRENLPHIFREPKSPVRHEDFISWLLEDESVGLFVAEVEGQLAGFVHVVIRDSSTVPIFLPRRFAVIDQLAVKEDFRRSGVGRRLMRKAERWAIKNGARDIELNVFEFNQEAVAFYERLGYENLSRRMTKPLK